MTTQEMICEIQSELGLTVDGKAGPQTWGRIWREIVNHESDHAAAPSDISTVDARSERNIQTLLPEVRPYARSLVHAAAGHGIEIRIIGGTRTYEQQDVIFSQGRTAGGKIVTKARGGQSNHNFGIAFDIGVFDNGDYLEESPLYKVIGAIGRDLGLEWGGDWQSIQDEPHFQLRPAWAAGLKESAMMAGLRARHNEGRDMFA